MVEKYRGRVIAPNIITAVGGDSLLQLQARVDAIEADAGSLAAAEAAQAAADAAQAELDLVTDVVAAETLVGTWLGSPLYRKVITIAAGPNNSTVNVAHGPCSASRRGSSSQTCTPSTHRAPSPSETSSRSSSGSIPTKCPRSLCNSKMTMTTMTEISTADRLAELREQVASSDCSIADQERLIGTLVADEKYNELRNANADLDLLRAAKAAKIAAIKVLEQRIAAEQVVAAEQERLAREAEARRILLIRTEVAAKLEAAARNLGELWREFQQTLVTSHDANRERLFAISLIAREAPELTTALLTLPRFRGRGV